MPFLLVEMAHWEKGHYESDIENPTPKIDSWVHLGLEKMLFSVKHLKRAAFSNFCLSPSHWEKGNQTYIVRIWGERG